MAQGRKGLGKQKVVGSWLLGFSVSYPPSPGQPNPWFLRTKSCGLMEISTHHGWATPETSACSRLCKESVRIPGIFPAHLKEAGTTRKSKSFLG